MPETPYVGARVTPELIDAARRNIREPDVSLSVLVRAGLLALAGLSVREALAKAQTKPGPKPKAGAAA
jgi:hypothetical protein